MERLALIGVGLMGASAGLAAKKRGLAREVVGFSRNKSTADKAKAVGAIDRAEADLETALEGADFVLISVPVDAIAARVREAIKAPLADGAVITDVGSVKAAVVRELEGDAEVMKRFVPGHPVAGTEQSGPEAAKEDLFEGRHCVLTPVAATPKEMTQKVRAFWEGLGMSVEEMTPQAHDEALAMISHLPHLVAYALVGAVAKFDEGRALELAAGGFRDFTRIAASSAQMWRQIVAHNAEASEKALALFRARLDEIQKFVEEKRWDDLEKLFEEAARVRRSLK